MKQLVRLRDKHAEITAAGGALLAISVDTPDKTQGMLDMLKQKEMALPFPVVCDPTKATVKAHGVYDHAHDIALPAILILDKAGKVAWKYVGESVFDRPEEAELVATLTRLKGS